MVHYIGVLTGWVFAIASIGIPIVMIAIFFAPIQGWKAWLKGEDSWC